MWYKKNGVPLPAVHAFDQDSIGTPLQCTYGVSTPPYMDLKNQYLGMRYYWSKFLNGCKETKKKPFTNERRAKKLKNFFPMVWNRCVDAFVRNDPPVSRFFNAVPYKVHMMNDDIAEDEDFVFVDLGVFHFDHPWTVGGVKIALTSHG